MSNVFKDGDDIHEYLASHEQKDMLRFLTCGSVDDGKSTLIGRLLHDAQSIFDDQLETLGSDSKKFGTQGGEIDFALLVDGLAAEREQGITIDVAYRFFSTDKRKFIVADTPGHEQYTRNMATGASTADVAIILIDARQGVLPQTRRHSFICSLLGIRHVVVAINKMDIVDFSEAKFRAIEEDYREFAKQLDFESITCMPLSALKGDNILTKSSNTPWYDGAALLPWLETVDVTRKDERPFRMPVQWVNRPNLDFRGFAGTVVSGRVEPGDEVVILPSGKRTKVKAIVARDGDLAFADKNRAVTLTLEDEVDASRGDVIAAATAPAEQAGQLQAKIIWMDDEEMLPGRQYILKSNNKMIPAQITDLKHRIDVNTLEHLSGKTLKLNEIGECNLSLTQRLVFDPYTENRSMGSFILIDRLTNSTVGVGMIDYALRRSKNVHWQALEVNKESRQKILGQKSCMLWFTGLSGSGKSTVANLVEKRLHDLGRLTYVMDGDNVRHGLNRDLGFTDADRVENIRRVGEAGKLMVDAGVITLVSFISPFETERQSVRERMDDGEFIEVFISTPLEVAEQRDVKGLYAKARKGEIKNFTGIDSPYEEPTNPEITVDTSEVAAEKAAEMIVEYLDQKGYLG
ncbi:sulfate adenylyltransferase subunit CysN [Parvularcula sp. ZS-1/3]|uniref:Multifunctional fusion protein n=1 Tax=Parvularcula mediterranea TaxID=2732508 RepID=A0A7Y3W4S5_9PROT|nr:sulfate adenylyltransferase subunit CysN [Parvularcula mediterranea]NNU16055.1 sulfate adenylyltransferase subunit CysN [Parvularcula mediterranea]